MANTLICQPWRTNNDINGNSNVLWVVYDLEDGVIIDAQKQDGYSRPKEMGDLHVLPPVRVTRSEYLNTLRFFKTKKRGY